MMERLGWLGADLAVIVISVGSFAVAAWIGLVVAQKTKRQAVGWILGGAAFILLSLIFHPSISALRQV